MLCKYCKQNFRQAQWIRCTNRDMRRPPMSADNDEKEPVPFIQKLLDNPFLLLFIGVLIPMLVYNLWGVIDILTLPATR